MLGKYTLQERKRDRHADEKIEKRVSAFSAGTFTRTTSPLHPGSPSIYTGHASNHPLLRPSLSSVPPSLFSPAIHFIHLSIYPDIHPALSIHPSSYPLVFPSIDPFHVPSHLPSILFCSHVDRIDAV